MEINMNTKVQFNMDINVKNRMSELCETLGMTMSQAFNMFASAFLREGGLPSQIATVPESFWVDSELGDLLDTSDKLDDAIIRLNNGEGMTLPEKHRRALREMRSERDLA
jgi:DNA-damage-inducible protein J